MLRVDHSSLDIFNCSQLSQAPCAGLPGVLARLRGNKAMMARSPTARARAQTTPALSASAGSLLVRTTSVVKWMMVTQQYWPFLAVGITIFLSTLGVDWLWMICVIQGSSVLFAKEVGPMIRIILPAVLKKPRKLGSLTFTTWTSNIALWDQHLKTMSKESDINSSTAQNIQLTFGFTNPTRYTKPNIIQLNPTFPTQTSNKTTISRARTVLPPCFEEGHPDESKDGDDAPRAAPARPSDVKRRRPESAARSRASSVPEVLRSGVVGEKS